jgi:hypothetical protein
MPESGLNELLRASAALCMRVKAGNIIQSVTDDLAVSAMQGLAVTPITMLTLLNVSLFPSFPLVVEVLAD